ncbi:MAG: NAD(P)H-dependent glycerol-3-phosphate dehydrogenase [Magnetovibrionaceae bacterium]
MSDGIESVGVLGAGAWGTALAAVVARKGLKTVLAAREAEVVSDINRNRTNSLFLEGVTLPDGIVATQTPADVLGCDLVLQVTPSQFMRASLEPLSGDWPPGLPLVLCCKGVETGSGALMTDVARQALGPGVPLAVLSGPTFAGEVAAGLPTALTLAMTDKAEAHRLAQALAAPAFRVYAGDDLVGSEVGGAVKNVLAIACGIVEGRGLGDNARAALITRGIAEISRLGLALGAKPETLMGLSGIGDITLTCNAMQSRNFSLGAALGKGETLSDILNSRRTVAEGVATAASVVALGARHGVELPIAGAVNAILHEGADINQTIQALLSRPLKAEG